MGYRVVLFPGSGIGPGAAGRLEQAVGGVTRAVTNLTYDIKPTRDEPTAVVLGDVADAIIEMREKPT